MAAPIYIPTSSVGRTLFFARCHERWLTSENLRGVHVSPVCTFFVNDLIVVLPGYNWILQGDPVSGKELQCGQGSLGLDVALPVI